MIKTVLHAKSSIGLWIAICLSELLLVGYAFSPLTGHSIAFNGTHVGIAHGSLLFMGKFDGEGVWRYIHGHAIWKHSIEKHGWPSPRSDLKFNGPFLEQRHDCCCWCLFWLDCYDGCEAYRCRSSLVYGGIPLWLLLGPAALAIVPLSRPFRHQFSSAIFHRSLTGLLVKTVWRAWDSVGLLVFPRRCRLRTILSLAAYLIALRFLQTADFAKLSVALVVLLILYRYEAMSLVRGRARVRLRTKCTKFTIAICALAFLLSWRASFEWGVVFSGGLLPTPIAPGVIACSEGGEIILGAAQPTIGVSGLHQFVLYEGPPCWLYGMSPTYGWQVYVAYRESSIEFGWPKLEPRTAPLCYCAGKLDDCLAVGANQAGAFLRIPYWIPFAACVVAAMRMIWIDRPHPRSHCRACGYNMIGNTLGVCPECGEDWHPPLSRTPPRFHRILWPANASPP